MIIRLNINLEYKRRTLIERLKGNFNVNTAREFLVYAIHIIKDYGIRYVVYNLGELGSLVEAGEKALVTAGEEAKANNNGKVLIVNNKINSCLDYDNVSNELVALDTIKV